MDLWSAGFVYGGAAGMVISISLTLRYYKLSRGKGVSLRALLWSTYILTSMSLMYGLALYYLLVRDMYSLFMAILVSNVTMVAWLFLLTERWGSGVVVNNAIGDVVVVSGTIISEVLMGMTYTLYLNPRVNAGAVTLLLSSLNSPWFTVPMTAEALLSYLFVRPRGLFNRLAPLVALMMLFNPVMISGTAWLQTSIYASSILMIIAIVIMLDYLYRKSVVTGYDMITVLGYPIVMALMMILQFYPLLNPTYWLYYGLVVMVDMAWYLFLYLRSSDHWSSVAWITRPIPITVTLIAIFVGEIFMGGVLSIMMGFLNTGAFSTLINLNSPLIGLYNIIVFTATLTSSPGFLIMMGAEMGWLVIDRLRTIKNGENRIRYLLMFLAYWLYTFYAPTFLPSSFIKYPYLLWSMGLGTAGPLAPALVWAIVGTYIINVVLSLLFGSRQLCSITCSASYMWQGTFYNKLKLSPLNPIRRGSRGVVLRLRTYVGVTVYVMLGLLAILSLLNQLGITHVYVYGEDPLVFLYLLLFGFIWYIFFALAPVLGTYNCVTYGWCHWGLLNQVVGRFGLFKLVVKDPSLCIHCKSKACAYACPVGNTGLPGSFISKDYYKSSLCVGVGDCVEACPYGNIRFYDVRDVLARLPRWVRRLQRLQNA
jgi:polyferredoxin